jgi:uncharacterized Zn finger protein (UPF0148 family)
MIQKLHKTFAKLFGYFWTNCPICGTEFGGHQWKDDLNATLWSSDKTGVAICPNCAGSEVVVENNKKAGFWQI